MARKLQEFLLGDVANDIADSL